MKTVIMTLMAVITGFWSSQNNSTISRDQSHDSNYAQGRTGIVYPSDLINVAAGQLTELSDKFNASVGTLIYEGLCKCAEQEKSSSYENEIAGLKSELTRLSLENKGLRALLDREDRVNHDLSSQLDEAILNCDSRWMIPYNATTRRQREKEERWTSSVQKENEMERNVEEQLRDEAVDFAKEVLEVHQLILKCDACEMMECRSNSMGSILRASISEQASRILEALALVDEGNQDRADLVTIKMEINTPSGSVNVLSLELIPPTLEYISNLKSGKERLLITIRYTMRDLVVELNIVCQRGMEEELGKTTGELKAALEEQERKIASLEKTLDDIRQKFLLKREEDPHFLFNEMEIKEVLKKLEERMSTLEKKIFNEDEGHVLEVEMPNDTTSGKEKEHKQNDNLGQKGINQQAADT